MKTIDIEKEIKQDNKVLLGLNLRQLFTSVGAVIVLIIIVLFLGLDISMATIPIVAVAVVAYLVGWYKKDGMRIENLVIKYIQQYLYRNNCRMYKTKNNYVVLYNQEYARHKRIDMGNKKVARQVKKEQKKAKKQVKKQVCKPII